MTEDRSRHFSWEPGDIEFLGNPSNDNFPQGSTGAQQNQHKIMMDGGYNFSRRDGSFNLYKHKDGHMKIVGPDGKIT